jgi:vacuolar iron transporter family protein
MQQSAQYKLSGSDRIGGIVMGMSDGLIIPFAIVAGLSNALHSSLLIFQSGLVITVVGAVAMGLGGYYTSREQPHEHDDLHGLDFDKETVETIKQEQEKDEKVWAQQQEAFGMDLSMTSKGTARHHALYIALGYFFGGLIPILVFFFNAVPMEALRFSVVITLTSLFVFGFLKAWFMARNPLIGAIKSTLAGVTTAAVAFFLAGLFA